MTAMPRRQFSLKSIFAAMTLVAVALVTVPPMCQAVRASAPQPASSGLRQIGISLPIGYPHRIGRHRDQLTNSPPAINDSAAHKKAAAPISNGCDSCPRGNGG
jgi:hypothetical protein